MSSIREEKSSHQQEEEKDMTKSIDNGEESDCESMVERCSSSSMENYEGPSFEELEEDLLDLDLYEFTNNNDAEDEGSWTYPMKAGSLKKGGFIVIRGEACKIVNIWTHQVFIFFVDC